MQRKVQIMNARKRKKWQKQHGTYINPKECWDLYRTMAEFILPRLKQFKKDTMGYPGFGEMDTEEKWDIALDKMIQAFEYIIAGDDWWLYNQNMIIRMDYMSNSNRLRMDQAIK